MNSLTRKAEVAFQGEKLAQQRINEDEADVEIKLWEKWNSDNANDYSYNRRISGLTCVGEE